MKRWFGFLFYLILACPSQGLAFTPQEGHRITKEFNTYFFNRFGYHHNIRITDMVETGDSILINPDGSHYVFSYRRNRPGFVRLDQSRFHGHNFGRRLIFYNHHLYALGGYGFWVDHSKLIRFNWNSHEWDLVETQGDKPNGSALLSFVRHDTVFYVRSLSRGENNDLPRINSQIWALNLKTLEWSKYSLDPDIRMESVAYGYIVENDKWFVGTTTAKAFETIIDKSTGKLYINHSGPPLLAIPERGLTGYDFIEGAHTNAFILGDSLILYYADTERFFKADLSQFVFSFCREENVNLNDLGPRVAESNSGENEMAFVSERLIYWLGLLLLLFLFVLEKRSNSNQGAQKFAFNRGFVSRNDASSDDQGIAQKLHRAGTQTLSQEKLDDLLGIQEFDYDSRKLKRSRMIADLNKSHPGFIERRRDPADKRKFVYFINRLNFSG